MAGAALDTNILGYAAGLRQVEADDPKVDLAQALIAELQSEEPLVLPAQVLLELHFLLVRKARKSRSEAATLVGEYAQGNRVVPTTAATIADAFGLSSMHEMQTFDAVIVAAAAGARCDVLFSEDMRHGFEWHGVTVINPFA